MAGKIIYHLVQEDLWKKADGEGYLPPTYEADGFIHATEDAPHLIPVANYFYTDVPGKFLCLRIDTALLTSEVKYEIAGPVGDKPPFKKTDGIADGGEPGKEEAGDKGEEEPKEEEEGGGKKKPNVFPHIYGPIDVAAVTAEYVVNRSETGAFLGIEGLLP